MPKSPIRVIVVMLGLLVLPVYVGALQIEPGKWEMTTTAINPMSPQPRTDVIIQCMTDAEMSPEGFMVDAQECTTSNVVSTDEVMKWDMACDMDGTLANGNAEFNSTGTTANGHMQITMEFNGQQMKLERTWDGQRIGPCD